MLLSAVNVAISVGQDSLYDSGNCVLRDGYDDVVQELKKAYHVVSVRWKDAQHNIVWCE